MNLRSKLLAQIVNFDAKRIAAGGAWVEEDFDALHEDDGIILSFETMMARLVDWMDKEPFSPETEEWKKAYDTARAHLRDLAQTTKNPMLRKYAA